MSGQENRRADGGVAGVALYEFTVLTAGGARPGVGSALALEPTAGGRKAAAGDVTGHRRIIRAVPKWKPPTPGRVDSIRDGLRSYYGRPQFEPHARALDELILTLLSQNTSDRNRDVAYLRLCERFPSKAEAEPGVPLLAPDWAAVRDAPYEAVEEAIRPGGLSKVKAARMQEILVAIGDPPNLEFLADLPVPEARDYLTALPGVGRKTAACVLLFSFGAADIPVDTHVSRVGERLGLFRPKSSLEERHDAMLGFTPAGEELELHLNILRLGRKICAARKPLCGECPLSGLCPSAQL